MKKRTLVEIYNDRKKRPTPAEQFIIELSDVTHRTSHTVKGWVRGHFRPDINTQIILAKHLNSDVESLFPSNNK